MVREPDFGAIQLRIFVIALVHFEDEVGATKMRVHLMLIHVICGMGVEVAGTEHVATARFDITGGHVEFGFGRFLLRGSREVDETGGKRKERKQKDSRQTTHGSLRCIRSEWGTTRNYRNSTPGVWRIQPDFLFDLENGTNVRPSRTSSLTADHRRERPRSLKLCPRRSVEAEPKSIVLASQQLSPKLDLNCPARLIRSCPTVPRTEAARRRCGANLRVSRLVSFSGPTLVPRGAKKSNRYCN